MGYPLEDDYLDDYSGGVSTTPPRLLQVPYRTNLEINGRLDNPANLPRIAIALGSQYESLCVTCNYAISIAVIDFIDAIREGLRTIFVGPTYRTFVRSAAPGGFDVQVFRDGEDDPLFYIDTGFDGEKDLWEKRRLHFGVTLWGDQAHVKRLVDYLDERFGRERLATVKWWYKVGADARVSWITMEEPPPIYDSFYPWLEVDGQPVTIAEFYERYMGSSAAILFMQGEPGTGKTSLLRHFIFAEKMRAVVSYDQQLLSNDQMFVDFLQDSNNSVLVIEDADMLVASRRDGNSLMSRFLNVSDGLVRPSGKKKIIFTTNQDDFQKVDDALIRPGRCFGALNARKLTYEEACRAAEDAGIAMPVERKDYSLGDLFNPDAGSPIKKHHIGIR